MNKCKNKLDKRREQEELHNILSNQSMYKHLVPHKEHDIKPYVEKYETNDPDPQYTLGGFEVNKGPPPKGKSRRQNSYLPPNPIVNPLNDFNVYIRQQIASNKHKYAAGGGGN